MSIATPPLPRTARLYPLPVCASRIGFTNPPLFLALLSQQTHLIPLRMAAPPSLNASRCRIGASLSGDGFGESPRRSVPGQLSLDELLSVAEALCVAPPIMCSIWGLVSAALPGAWKRFQVSFGSKFFALQYYLLVGAVVIGSLIRWRQWQRICRANEDGAGCGLIERIEKVEEDSRSSATIIRVLSRQLEKLGIRFRVFRKSLKEPVAETASLAQKNSEATRALAMQEEILEQELGEIQNVLLAMQEQQQKQLELILAIGKAGRLLDSEDNSVEGSSGTSDSTSAKKEMEELETLSGVQAG